VHGVRRHPREEEGGSSAFELPAGLASNANRFQWTEQARADGLLVTPKLPTAPTAEFEFTACEIKGSWNNADVYLSASDTWLSPPGGGTLLLRLYALVGGAPYLLEQVDPNTLTKTLVGGGFRAYALGVRGRPCDGFRVTVATSLPLVNPPFAFGPGQLTIFAWGKETSESTGAASHVTIDGQPIAVTGTLDVIDTPAAAWSNQHGTAPDNTVAAFAALAAGAASRYVEISADAANTGTLYVASSALAIGGAASAAYELFAVPGSAPDSVRLVVDNASKIFVAGSAAGQKYRVAVV
jgi:hypothetical protein